MNFKEWLFLQEETNRFKSLSDRVTSGRRVEAKIIDSMSRQHGWMITNPSERQDKYEKIDGFVTKTPDKIPVSYPAAIQVKFRDREFAGDDIAMEVVRSFNGRGSIDLNNLSGRDVKGLAKIYLSLSRSGTLIRARLADEAKSIALNLLRELLFLNKTFLVKNGSTIRVTKDPSSGDEKILAFISPNDPSFTWKREYPIGNIWDAIDLEDELERVNSKPEHKLPKDVPPSILPAIDQALATGSASFRLSSNAKKVRAVEQYVKKKGLKFSIENGQIMIRK